jgi:uncharacterized protein (DUF1778 family)
MMEKKSEKKVPEKSKRARITLECTPEIRKSIRIRAAQEDKSMNDYILSIVMASMNKGEAVADS